MNLFANFIKYLIIRLMYEGWAAGQNHSIERAYEKLIAGSMDLSVDPCEDFYRYACGKWEDYHQDAEGKYHEILTMGGYEADMELVRYMNETNMNDKPRFVRNAHAYYKSCVNMSSIDLSYYRGLMESQANVQWHPFWKTYSKNYTCDWVRTLGVLRRYGLNGIFIEETALGMTEDRTQKMIELNMPVTSPLYFRLSPDDLEGIVDSLNYTDGLSSLVDLWHNISAFEKRLMDLGDIEDDVGKQRMTVQELPLPWLAKYLATTLNVTSLDANMEVVVKNIPYMKALDKLLHEYDDLFIHRYVEIRFIRILYDSSPPEFSALGCLRSTRKLMSLATNWIYDQEHPEFREYEPDVQRLVENVAQHFNRTLRTNTMGFNETLLEHLLAKLESIQLKIGNLPRFDAVQLLESYYSDLALNISDFYGNQLKLWHFYYTAEHSNMSQPSAANLSQYFHWDSYYDGDDFMSTPYFLNEVHVAIVPQTILRQPFYHPDYDAVYKYSSLGSVLAHEILHGFDRIGLYYDSAGQINTGLRKEIMSNPKFDRNYKCLLQLYPNVFDEKIADVGGLRFAYEAYYTEYPKALAENRTINGRTMTSQQLFFLNFGQYFCDSSDVQSEHGSATTRVNDALSHFSEFSKAYGCSGQSKMQMVEKCQLWRR